MSGRQKTAGAVKMWKILPGLALKGTLQNGTVYYLYLGAGIFSAFTYYVFASILHNDIIRILPKSAYAWMFLEIGRVLLGIILLPFLFYTNSFLIKRRKKEIGLYHILGLEKKHIAVMLFTESVLTYGAALAGGIVSGTVLSKLLFLLLLRMTGLPVDVRFHFSVSAVGETAMFFLVVYAVNFLADLIQVGKARPTELLSGGKRGEKEPRLLWLWALLGLVSLGMGYWDAVCSEVDSMIFMNFFGAVFWVIIGTYLLFTSGSVAVLKILRRKKGFYYKPSNFITVSGMLYRMKKSAASLSNICIFSTMVIITLICTSTLYLGLGGMLDFNFPFQMDIYWRKAEMQENAVRAKIGELEEKYGVETENYLSYERITLLYGKEGETFGIPVEDEVAGRAILEGNYEVSLLLLEDYNAMEGRDLKLRDNEAVIFTSGPGYGYDRTVIMGKEIRVKEEAETLRIAPKSMANTYREEYFLVVKDEAARDALVEDWAEANGVEDVEGLLDGRYQMIRLDVAGGEPATEGFEKELEGWCRQAGCVRFDNNLENRTDWKVMYGGLLFLGVLFSIVFFMCLLLIMYYKQIVEGYEDQESFGIMQKVGMSEGEIRKTVHRQILMVFFLPVMGAVMHAGAGTVMVGKLFVVLSLFDTRLLSMCMTAVMAVFAVLYGVSYLLTAKTYYRIVSRG